jgi:UDP-N-acetyl-D-galactosamine dehydrogenase
LGDGSVWVDVFGITPFETIVNCQIVGLFLGVGHQQFKVMGADAIRALGKADHVLYDLKYVLSQAESDLRL